MGDIAKLYSYRRRYFIVQGLMLLISFLCLYFKDFQGPPELFMFFCVWNLATYLHVFYFELKYSPQFHPFIILALTTAQYIGLSGFNYYPDLVAGKPIYFVSTEISDMLVGGIWFLMLQHYLTFAGYDYVFRKKYKQDSPSVVMNVERTDIDYYKWAIRSYVVLWIVRVVGMVINLAAISSIFSSYAAQGQNITLTLLFFGALKAKKGSLDKIYWVITVLEILRVLGHGMKEEIIVNLVPYGIFLLLAYKSGILKFNSRFVLRLGLLGTFVVYGVFPYVSIFRTISYERRIDWSEVPVADVIAEYGDYILKEGKYSDLSDEEYSERSTKYAMDRAGSIGCNAWLVNRTAKKGTDSKFFMYCVAGLVPRVLWPDKPPVLVGNMMYELARGHSDWDVRAQDNYRKHIKVTSLAPGFVGSSYMSFGLLGAIISFIIPGVFIALVWFFIKDKLSYNVIAIWFFYGIIGVLLKDFEAFKDGGISFYGMSLIYCAIIYLFPNRKYTPIAR